MPAINSENTTYTTPAEPRERTYPNFDERESRTLIVFAAADDGNLFVDAECETELPHDEAKKLFLMNMLVIKFEGGYYIPTCMTEEEGVATFVADTYTFKA